MPSYSQLSSPPQIFAHRGASGYAPENTLAAFRTAADLGFNWIETDCMLTRDGRVILHHDYTLKRVTGVESFVSETDYADLSHLDCGTWFDPDFSQERIPTLEQAIDLYADLGMGVNLELKPCPGAEVETATAVAEIVSNFWPDHLPVPIISSFSKAAFEAAWPLLPGCPFAIIWHALPEDWHSEMKNIGADVLHLDTNMLQQHDAQCLVAEGMDFSCYTVNSSDRYAELMSWGAVAVFSDFPDRLGHACSEHLRPSSVTAVTGNPL